MEHPIYPCFWFDNQAAEAANWYCSIFSDARMLEDNNLVSRFSLEGQEFMCLNGGPRHKINPSISIFAIADTAEELDRIWNKLNEGGKVLMELDQYPWSERYGWVEDKYGVNWQLSVGNVADVGQRYTCCLMFCAAQQGRAEEAMRLYTSIFSPSSIAGVLYYDDGPMKGQVKHEQFTLGSTVMMAMDSGVPQDFTFTEGLSLVVTCGDQQQIDKYWSELTADGGSEQMCGWLKDKYGVSWQIVPAILAELMWDKAKAPKVVEAFMKMKKFDIAELKRAADS